MFNKILTTKFLSAIMLSSLFIGCGSTDNNVAIAGVENRQIDISVEHQELVDAINKARSVQRDCYPNDDSRGVVGPSPKLYWNDDLYASALEHSTDLAESNTFSHYGSGTSSDITGDGKPSIFYERIVANGYSNYYSVGENIAGGQKDLNEVMEAWLASPGHCENIMNPNYTEVGVAIVTKADSTYGIYWTQNFGSKRQ
jgi:uncharacterized protein YkwD